MMERIGWKRNFGSKLPGVARSLAGWMAVAVLFAIGTGNAPAAYAQAAPAAAPAQTAAAPASEVHAKGDIAGDWQGTMKLPNQELKLVLRVSKAGTAWTGTMFLFVDKGAQPIKIPTVTLDGSTVKYSVDLMGASYQGTLSPDGNSIVGTMTGAPGAPSLTLVRATKETAWEIPPPPPPPKMMPADANPSFDVATIKPNPSGGASMQGLTMNGNKFRTRNSSLADLIAFAYSVQLKQIVNAPDWTDKDRVDIEAIPDQEGAPSPEQLRIMLRKLLTDRYKLKFHKEKRDLSAYVLTVGKDGQKLTPTQLAGPLPGIGMRPMPSGLMLGMRNATVSDFTEFLQILVLDKPVVDQTGITGRFDYSVTFMPDDWQFNGHPPKITPSDTVTPSPPLADALLQQLGLRLNAEKTAVDVISIDHVEKPSEN
jgi:uncharacterized protein (TIGR03435 family)